MSSLCHSYHKRGVSTTITQIDFVNIFVHEFLVRLGIHSGKMFDENVLIKEANTKNKQTNLEGCLSRLGLLSIWCI